MGPHASYKASKVLELSRSTFQWLTVPDVTVQQKIIWAIKPMKLCQGYLRYLNFTPSEPSFIAERKIDIGRIAGEEATYEELQIIRSMAPQHKRRFLEQLVDWWFVATTTAANIHGAKHGASWAEN